MSAQQEAKPPIVIAEQGSYAAGGRVIETPGEFEPTKFYSPGGNSAHVDHAYVRYQRPVKPRALPLVFWHGGMQFMRTWESTPDGREGFDSLMLRRDWEVHLLDQPRRASAGQSGSAEPMGPLRLVDRSLWQIFRLGIYPNFFPGVAFPQTAEAVNQYFRQCVQNIGTEDRDVVVAAGSAIFDRIGRGVLVTHSASGRYGFLTAAGNDRVNGVVTYEPGAIVIPDDYTLKPLEINDADVKRVSVPTTVPAAQFAQLTRIPIQIIFGDNIPAKPSTHHGLDLVRVQKARAHEFCDLINARGGRAELLHLPAVGVHGNTHFMFSDLNNVVIADLLSEYLHKAGLDAY